MKVFLCKKKENMGLYSVFHALTNGVFFIDFAWSQKSDVGEFLTMYMHNLTKIYNQISTNRDCDSIGW